MATRTQSRQSNRSSSPRSRSSGGNRSSSERSAFSWGENGPIIAAALGGAAIGFAANFGRKLITQAVSGIAGDWDEVLATEHDMTLAVFDKMLATDSTQTWKRSMLLMQLTHALDKHAHEEEMVVYPALRDAGQRPRPTSSTASTAISRPSSTTSARWGRKRRTGSKRSGNSVRWSPNMRRWRKSRSSPPSSAAWTKSRTPRSRRS